MESQAVPLLQRVANFDHMHPEKTVHSKTGLNVGGLLHEGRIQTTPTGHVGILNSVHENKGGIHQEMDNGGVQSLYSLRTPSGEKKNGLLIVNSSGTGELLEMHAPPGTIQSTIESTLAFHGHDDNMQSVPRALRELHASYKPISYKLPTGFIPGIKPATMESSAPTGAIPSAIKTTVSAPTAGPVKFTEFYEGPAGDMHREAFANDPGAPLHGMSPEENVGALMETLSMQYTAPVQMQGIKPSVPTGTFKSSDLRKAQKPMRGMPSIVAAREPTGGMVNLSGGVV